MTAAIGKVYESLLARAKHAAHEDVPVIGYVGTDTPVELIDSVGALAYRLGSSRGDLRREAIDLLGSAVDYPALSILSQALSGELDFLRGLVISRDCQASLRLFYVLRQLRADGRALPQIHLVDLLHLPRESTARYNLSQVTTLAEVLAAWIGSVPNYEDVRYAVERREQVRAALADVQSARRGVEPTVTGTDALRLHAIAQRSLPEDAVEIIRAVRSETAVEAGLRLFVTGSGQDHDENYARLEAAGAHVVGEDHSWGDLALGIVPDVTSADDLRGLYDAVARARQVGGPASQTSGLRDRAAYTARELDASRADAVLSLIRSADVAPDWDYPKVDTVPAARLRGATHTWTVDELSGVVESLRSNRLEESLS